ncbi:MAG: chemotaxis protein CheW [Desulfatibacillaceae bacterium]
MEQTYATQVEEAAEKDEALQLVSFRIGKEIFGVNIRLAQEIIRTIPVTRVPNAPEFIEGVINLRGSIIPVIDLRKRLNLSAPQPGEKAGAQILIVDVDGRVTGFIVDEVAKVRKIQASQVEPPPDIVLAGLHSKYILGVCDIDGRLLILLDFGRILRVEEIRRLKDLDVEE